jgi:hypothetical protein
MRSAWLLVLVVGCGHDTRPPATSDAAGDSAAGDSGSADAPTGSATVTVRSLVHPTFIANTPVLFSDGSGAMVEAYTDAMGQATGTLAPGSSVTTMFDDQHLATIVDAMPGDNLTFGNGRLTSGGTLTVTFTAYTDPQATYRLYTPCSSYNVTPPMTTISLDFCNGPITDTDVEIAAYSNGVVMTSGEHHVDLTTGAVTVTGAWTPLKTIQATYPGVSYALSVGFFDLPESFMAGPGSITGTSTSFTAPTTAPIELIRSDVELGPDQYQSFVDRIANTATTYQLSSSDLRPWITSVTYDAATRTISSVAPASLTGDVVFYELIWGNPQSPYYWDIYAPAFQSVTLPALPADIPDPSTIPGTVTAVVALYDTSAYAGWDNVRPHVYEFAPLALDPSHVADRVYIQALSTN